MTLFIDNQKMDALSLRQWRENFNREYPCPVEHAHWSPEYVEAANAVFDAINHKWNNNRCNGVFWPRQHFPSYLQRQNECRLEEYVAWRAEMQERAELTFWLDPFHAMKLLEDGVVELWEHM